MNCPKCSQKMVQLLISYVCDFCDKTTTSNSNWYCIVAERFYNDWKTYSSNECRFLQIINHIPEKLPEYRYKYLKELNTKTYIIELHNYKTTGENRGEYNVLIIDFDENKEFPYLGKIIKVLEPNP